MRIFLVLLCVIFKLYGGEKEMIIAVGSTNNVKVQAVEEIIQEYPALESAKIVAISTVSGVSEQPLSLEERQLTLALLRLASNVFEVA
jgi:non-canonical (house-cleaning) NTP pyrophosphatase